MGWRTSRNPAAQGRPLRWGLRALAGTLGACLLVSGGAWAHGRPHAGAAHPTHQVRTAGTTVVPPAAVVKNDLAFTGTVTGLAAAAGAPAGTWTVSLKLDNAGPITEMVTPNTTIRIGPYSADASFLVPGAMVEMWGHVSPSGGLTADFVSIRPTVVEGTRVGPVTAAQDGTHLVTVDTTNGPVVVLLGSATVVHIVPPWDRSEGLSAATDIAAVGVLVPSGALRAVAVLGMVTTNA